MRIVSLVPSATDVLASLGVSDQLIGVTTYCISGAPDAAERLGGTKNPELQRVIALRPDLVVVNTEENKPEHIALLRDAGIAVEELYPRKVADVAPMLRRLGELVNRAEEAEAFAIEVEQAALTAEKDASTTRVMALTLVWRKPWMGLGPETYADDLLWTCGFANVLSGFDDPYPKLDPSFVLGPDVVLLPSEPYEFTDKDLDAVADLVGPGVPTRFVDGQALTWHGPRTAAAIQTFSDLAADLRT